MSEGCGRCRDCKRVREHVASLLPFRVLEAAAGKPLRISGVALAAGISRNFNVYTPEELGAFAAELAGSPLYIEHVAVPNAIGKVTKAFYDSASRCLMYEAEVYDEAMAEKIRNGLIQHVSVGADYDALDVVDAKVPHGLHNAELSLVAVPGIPEANIHVMERFAHAHTSVPASGKDHKPVRVIHEKLSVKELLEPLQCVFCGQPGEYLVSVCTSCGDKADAVVNGHLPAAGPASQAAQSGVEKLEEKDLDEIAEKVAAKIGEKESAVVEKLKIDLAAANAKVAEAEGKTKTAEALAAEAASKLEAANRTVEDLRKQVPGGGLLVDPPKMMPVSEHVAVLEGFLPAPMVERSSLGMQRMCQGIRAELLKAKERLK